MNFLKLTIIQTLLFVSTLIADENQTIKKVSQLIQESHTPRADEVWPGFDLTVSPVMITFGNGHVYAFNLKSNHPGWQKIQVESSLILFSEIDHWGVSKSAMNPHFPIEGQIAYVFNLDQAMDNEQKLFEILVHERFHRYQFQHFPMEKMGGHYVDDVNVGNLTFMQMEEMALAQFFQAAGNPEMQKEYLMDFAAINQTRRALIKTVSAAWEDHQQVMEGLADYVSFKTFDVHPVFDHYDGNKKLKEMLMMYARNPDITERAVKWRHYGVGAAMGYGLDFLKVKGWKKEVERGSSMAALIGKAANLSPSEISERMEQIEVAYGFNSVREKIAASVANHQKELADLAESYGKLDGIAVQIGRPAKTSISGGGLTSRTLYLANGTTISLQDTSMMTNIENTWKLELKNIPFVIQNHAGIREFKIEWEMEVVLDGRSYTLRQLVDSNEAHSFDKIQLKGKSCRFTSEQNKGEINFAGGKVLINFY